MSLENERICTFPLCSSLRVYTLFVSFYFILVAHVIARSIRTEEGTFIFVAFCSRVLNLLLT